MIVQICQFKDFYTNVCANLTFWYKKQFLLLAKDCQQNNRPGGQPQAGIYPRLKYQISRASCPQNAFIDGNRWNYLAIPSMHFNGALADNLLLCALQDTHHLGPCSCNPLNIIIRCRRYQVGTLSLILVKFMYIICQPLICCLRVGNPPSSSTDQHHTFHSYFLFL